jgi:hypothetical protein
MLIREIGSRLKSIDLSEQQFNVIKERKNTGVEEFQDGSGLGGRSPCLTAMIRKEKLF